MSAIPVKSGTLAGGAYEACLLPLLDALGWMGGKAMLREAMPRGKGAMDKDAFLEAMANLKFRARRAQADLSDIDCALLPCLFVREDGMLPLVLLRRSGSRVLAFDGETGVYSMIDAIGSGEAVFFRWFAENDAVLLDRGPGWTAALALRFRGSFALLILLTLAVNLLGLASPLIVMGVYNQVLQAPSGGTVLFLSIGMVMFLLTDSGFRFLRGYVLAYLSTRMGNIIGNQVVRRILYLPPSYTESAPLASQLSRIRDFESMVDFMAGPAVILLELPLAILAVAVIAFLGGGLVWVPLAGVGLLGLVCVAATRMFRAAGAGAADSGAKRHEFQVETLTTLPALRSAGLSETWSRRFRDLSADASMQSFRAARLNSALSSFSQMLVAATGLLTMAVGATLVMAGTLDAGALMACMLLTWRSIGSFRSVLLMMSQLDRVRKSVDQVDRLMNMPLENRSDTVMRLRREIKGRVQFVQVSLRYTPEANPAVVGLSFDLSPGSVLAVAGHDGAGKTSVLKMLLSMYRPQAGRILLDGMNIWQMDPLLLRGALAYAPEELALFPGTVRENILLSDPAALEADILRAVEDAGIGRQIKALGLGLDTVLDTASDRNAALLRGIVLARVWLRRTNLRIFDEPFRGMDNEQAESFREKVRNCRGQETVILATNERRGLELADQILLLDEGRVRAFGPADRILTQFKGEFRG